LSERLDRLVDVGVSLATRVRFAELVAAGQWDSAVQIMKAVPAEFRFFERIALFDLSGTLMASTPATNLSGQNFARRDWYRSVSKDWKPVVSGVYQRSVTPPSVVFAIAIPVTDRGGAPTGILQAQVQLENFFEWAQAIDVGNGGVVYVVDASGNVAFDSRKPQQSAV